MRNSDFPSTNNFTKPLNTYSLAEEIPPRTTYVCIVASQNRRIPFLRRSNGLATVSRGKMSAPSLNLDEGVSPYRVTVVTSRHCADLRRTDGSAK